MIISTTLAICMVTIFYVIVPFLILIVKNKKAQKILAIISFCIFIAVLIVGTLGKIDISKNNTTITFENTGKWFDKNINFSFSNLTKQDILINLFMLIPVGFFASYVFENKKWWAKILIATAFGFCFGFAIEFCQFTFPVPRSVQFSDVIFNTISSTLGALLFLFYQFLVNKIHKKQNT